MSSIPVPLFTGSTDGARLVGIPHLSRVPVPPEHVVYDGRRWRVVGIVHLDPTEDGSPTRYVATAQVEDTGMEPPVVPECLSEGGR